jgi:hypothetical protein
MTWLYEGQPYNPPEEFSTDDYYAFVYLITNRATAQKYVGKKFFWSKKVLPKTKSRKRRKITYVESDWRTYYGSNRVLNEEREQSGNDMYYRQILHLCKTKGESSYMEAKEQFDREVLLTDEYYNGIISCKIGGQSVKNLKKNYEI